MTGLAQRSKSPNRDKASVLSRSAICRWHRGDEAKRAIGSVVLCNLRFGESAKPKAAIDGRPANAKGFGYVFDRGVVVLEQLSRLTGLVVWKLDRLGRWMVSLIAFVEELQKRGIGFRVLDGGFPIDTRTAQGRFFFYMTAALAEMERDLIRERTNAGLAAARARGRKGGRKPELNAKQIEADVST